MASSRPIVGTLQQHELRPQQNVAVVTLPDTLLVANPPMMFVGERQTALSPFATSVAGGADEGLA
jgi:hypothetical protein